MPEPIVLEDYDQLIRALVARRHELGISQSDLDDMAGWTSTYSSKLEAGMRQAGVVLALWLWPAALGYRVALLPAADAAAIEKRARRDAAVKSHLRAIRGAA